MGICSSQLTCHLIIFHESLFFFGVQKELVKIFGKKTCADIDKIKRSEKINLMSVVVFLTCKQTLLGNITHDKINFNSRKSSRALPSEINDTEIGFCEES